MNMQRPIAYIGPAGAGFGFRLSGVEVFESDDGEGMLQTLKRVVASGTHDIIFVDEGLASAHLDAVARLNREPRPAVILLPNPANPQHVAARNLQQLMVRAVGTDIFS